MDEDVYSDLTRGTTERSCDATAFEGDDEPLLSGIGEASSLQMIVEAIARKSAVSSAAKGLKAWQLRRSPIPLGAVEIQR